MNKESTILSRHEMHVRLHIKTIFRQGTNARRKYSPTKKRGTKIARRKRWIDEKMRTKKC